MIIDAAGERSEQGRFLSKSPGSSNAVLARTALEVLGLEPSAFRDPSQHAGANLF